jgi:LPS export ABC transporter protein LptC
MIPNISNKFIFAFLVLAIISSFIINSFISKDIDILNSPLKNLENNIKIKKVLRPIIHKENKKGEKYVIIADTLQESQTKDGEVKLENSLTTINKNGILTEIIAGYAIITNNYEDFNLTKKVTIIKKSRDFELKTNSLIGSMKKGNFFTNDKVFIVSGNITILGAGMDLKRNGEYIKIRGKAKLVMLLSKNNEN